jgi:hypothetical protein
VGLTAGLDAVGWREISCPYRELNPVVQPVARRYTDIYPGPYLYLYAIEILSYLTPEGLEVGSVMKSKVILEYN